MNKNKERNNLKSDFKGFLKTYKIKSYLDALKEAIVNSIQANAKNINIKIFDDKGKILENMSRNTYIDKIVVEDDGEGFNKINRESFATLFTQKKEQYGCKGVGRASYLKLFNDVKIESFLKSENKKVELDFNENFKEADFKESVYSVENNKTILTLSNPKEKKVYEEENVVDEVRNHILYYLIVNKELNIFINKIKVKKEDNVENKTFKVSGIEDDFVLFYKIEETKDIINRTDDIIIINGKSMETFKDIFKIDIGNRDNYKMLFLLKSNFFDKSSTIMHNLDVKEEEKPESNTEPEFDFNKPSRNQLKEKLKKIKEQLIKELRNIITDNNISKHNEKIKNNITTKYLHYSNYIDINNKNYFFLDEKTIIDNARKKYFEIEKKIISNEENKEELKKFISTNLNAYIIYRQKIINDLKEIFEKADKETKEKKIHDLFIPQGTNTNTVDLANNNLWLLDDKFMTFDKIYSEQELQKILPIDYENILEQMKKDKDKYMFNDIDMNNVRERRPDIAIFKNENNILNLVLLEFIKPKAIDYDYNKGIAQLRLYAEYFARKFKIINPFAFLLVNDLEHQDELRSEINNYPIIYNYNNKLIYQTTKELNGTKYNSNGKLEQIGSLNLQVISIDAMIENANLRNQTFIGIIKDSLNK